MPRLFDKLTFDHRHNRSEIKFSAMLEIQGFIFRESELIMADVNPRCQYH